METKKTASSDIITIPNILSFIRLCMIPLIVWLYCGKGDYVFTGILLVISGITDLVDGFLARRFGWVSDLGKILDPIADKLTQAAMLICLVLTFPMILLPFGLMVAKELFMSITGSLVIRKTGRVFGARWHGKAATVALYAMMTLHVFWKDIPQSVSHSTILLASTAIALSFLLYGKDNLHVLKRNYNQEAKTADHER